MTKGQDALEAGDGASGSATGDTPGGRWIR
jgi:hypothetical protein